MATAEPRRQGNDLLSRAAQSAPEERRRRSARLATAGLVGVLVVLVAFAGAGAVLNARLASAAQQGTQISELYQAVERALLVEDSAQHEFLYKRQDEQRQAHAAAAGSVLQALETVRAAEQAEHRGHVDELIEQQQEYLATLAPVFDRVQRTAPRVGLVEYAELERKFYAIQRVVADEAAEHRGEAREAVATLGRSQRLVLLATPVVFGVGLALVALFARVLRNHRRELDAHASRTRHQALHDTLTGLPNRALLADRFGQALRTGQRDTTAVGLLLIDLDRFKEINDTFGHHYGDALLTQVGPRLTGVLREADTIARLGGDEFAVLLPAVLGIDAVTAVARKLQAALQLPFRVEGVDLDVEASIGAVISGEHGDDAITLMQRADIAMYAAKTQNLEVCAYDPTVDGHSPDKLALLGDLRRALSRDELVLHYQPKISITTGVVVGAEALVRWQHPGRGLIFPDTFIPLAEHTGLIGPLTRHVLSAALRQARAWADSGQPLPVSVNLSARNLLDERLPAQVAELLAEHGVPASLLELEVTESAIMTEPARAQRLLEALAALGVRLSIDDFGAGYTSLSQLKNLPVAELKIDKSFVISMASDDSDALIVQSVVDLGHNLGLTLVAEGVEDTRALTMLNGYGCDVAQGYHLSRPISIAAFDQWRSTRPDTAALLPRQPTANDAPTPTGPNS